VDDDALGPADRFERDSALDRATRALARRDHSAASLEAKLARAGVSAEARAETIGRLEAAGYVDDARFAADRAAHLAGKGYGDEWIRADLASQGVGPETVEDALAALAPEPERAAAQAERLGGGVRAGRTLARRGFSEDCLERFLADG
jgi:regulatory protein